MLTIIKLKEVNQGPLKFVLSVLIDKWGGFIIEDIKLFESKGARWFHFPNRAYEDGGKMKYFSYNRFQDKDVNEQFQKQLFKAADDYISNKINHGII